MPGGDGTGPEGLVPYTGRGQGTHHRGRSRPAWSRSELWQRNGLWLSARL